MSTWQCKRRPFSWFHKKSDCLGRIKEAERESERNRDCCQMNRQSCIARKCNYARQQSRKIYLQWRSAPCSRSAALQQCLKMWLGFGCSLGSLLLHHPYHHHHDHRNHHQHHHNRQHHHITSSSSAQLFACTYPPHRLLGAARPLSPKTLKTPKTPKTPKTHGWNC